MGDLLERAAALRAKGLPFAVATVVRAERPSSARAGMKALILPDGTLEGWVGGSCAHPVVLTEALQTLREGIPRLICLSPTPPAERPGVIHHVMTCHSGGSLEIYIEPVLPRPVLLLIGDAPLVAALAEMGRLLAFDVWMAGLPHSLEELAERITPDTAVVVATMGTYDEEALLRVLGSPAGYVALVASRRRAEAVAAYLRGRGMTEAQIRRIKVPAGLDIGAVTPEEIALSILAELVQIRRGRTLPVAPAPAPAAAIDPICGMAVTPGTAQHTVEFAGMRYYFCSAHCRQTFERDPAAYAAAGA
ncbi:MAG: XdhC family protein [Armatimonadota bacterium]|nr:XdhC family protein [Armatimonadota bacterium]MDR7452315.1 XdhC family protein [Armatimonadota bacterium]MDR7467794.1 XdhC family protein [Armatimonadota bacterium]MDR7494620.1 XdhC family protein [Armatimonadota bacterium]MDR7499680.1 XdhC family protein [Armatimonadota bacterium]